MPEIKPLETKGEQARKEKKRFKIIIGIIIAFLMIASTIGYAILEGNPVQQVSQNVTSYKNYDFLQTGAGWQTLLRIDSKNITLNTFNLPQEVENISSEGSPLLQDFLNKAVFIAAETNKEKQAASQYNALGNIVLMIQFACSPERANSSFCIENNLPIKTCEDAGEEAFIIILQELPENSSEQASVNYKNSCFEVKGKAEELVKANDKALFMTFGIL